MNVYRNMNREKLSRRKLKFETYDELRTELDLLSQSGYHRTGKWSLGKICDHLSRFIDQSLTGFEPPSFFVRLMQPLARMLYLGKIMKGQQLGGGMPTIKSLLPEGDPDDDKAVAAYQKSLERMLDPNATFQPSPLFGDLTADQWRKVHLWHAAHHLSFLVPGTGN